MLRRGRSILTVAMLVVSSIFLAGFGGQPQRGDLSKRVWYYGQLVPYGELLDKGVVPQCHDGLGPGVITCYDTKEEVVAATGVSLAGADKVVVDQLRASGAVAQVQASYYACVYEGVELTGASLTLSSDYPDFKEILFDNITSSIEIPAGAGYSTYYDGPGYGGFNWAFSTTMHDLRPYGLDNKISSARRGYCPAP